MKATATLALLAAMSAALLALEPAQPAVQSVPKNLARQHSMANLLIFDKTTQRFVSAEAAAAWLDDDVTTGFAAAAGKQHYLLQFANSEPLTSFSISGAAPTGTVNLYVGDTPSTPGDISWSLAAKNVSLADINQKKTGAALNKTGKYVLIESDIAQPSAIYSLYVYGARSAATESIVKREKPVDYRALLGPYVNDATSFNVSSIYAKAEVTYANAGGNISTWQRAIDDNPESLLSVKPSTTESGLVAKLDVVQPLTRVSILADKATQGTVEVFLVAGAPEGHQPLNIDGMTPVATLKLDGTADRASADLAQNQAGAVVLRWTPQTEGTVLPLRELNTFGTLSLADYAVEGLAPIAEGKEGERDNKGLSGKETADFKGGKQALPPVGEGPGSNPEPVGAGPGGFSPGGLGVPPVLLNPESN
jgi:hypothetical protein